MKLLQTWDPGAEGAEAVDGAASAAVEKLLPLPGASGTYGSVVPICKGMGQGFRGRDRFEKARQCRGHST